mmetsp:Transcript_4415/g.9461  ORF Transcript_4415/g.9461 Transcript_4415/m.9461 type:complete len:80 (+) Transcript_4415:51-290(+)
MTTPNANSSMAPPVVCENCAKSTQQELPAEDATRTQCWDVYAKVEDCMKAHQGQISQCVVEWQTFQQCHETKVATPQPH